MIFTRKTGERIVLFKGGETLAAICDQIYQLTLEKHKWRAEDVAWELGVCGYTVRKKMKQLRESTPSFASPVLPGKTS